ncbi:DUF6232 family protein [Streptomyces griseus]|uniref:DUF6232 family protein n=1 Tax=Streptomyces TaxID=1883 RepID=UPI000804F9C3|nr:MULTISPECIES: DUF6232 family protein [Streptomyces]MYT76514.1 hypothetical protein [Streptomyces sp. SID8364]SBV08661.1 hypothetical protein YW3DRAFT_04675 [Streptomyces sp. MnatMP-M77]
MSVNRRMLWIGSAAFPLDNLTRVEATKVKPQRGATFLSFLKWLALTAVVYVVVNASSGGDARIGESGNPVFVVFLVGLVMYFIKELLEPAKPILAVETAGGSLAVVTLPSVDELRTIAGQIVHAINHPEAEFTAYVHELNNYNGPVFNQNGGTNTGIKL